MAKRDKITTVSPTAARLAIAAVITYQLMLFALMFIRTDLDPSWRALSEYARGPHGWIMSAAFLVSAVSYGSLWMALRSEGRVAWGKVGLGILFLCAIATAATGAFTTDPFDASVMSTRGLAACYSLCCGSLSAFLPGISGSRHFGPGKHEFHNDCANRSLPVQPQSYLFGFHPIRTRIVRLAEQPLDVGNACSGNRHHRDGCDPTRGTVPRTQLQRPVFELQGPGPSLVVRQGSPDSPAIEHKVEDANDHSSHREHCRRNIGIDQLIHIVEQEASVVRIDTGFLFQRILEER
jgi:hypothetical protein